MLALSGDAEANDLVPRVQASRRGLLDRDEEPLGIGHEQMVEQGHQRVEIRGRQRPSEPTHVVVDGGVPNHRALRKLGSAWGPV